MATCALCGGKANWPSSMCAECAKTMAPEPKPEPREEGDDCGHE